MKTTTEIIEKIMILGDEFEQTTEGLRGISEYIYERLSQDEKVAKRYILVLRGYGKKLMAGGVWNQAKDEKWDIPRIKKFVETE